MQATTIYATMDHLPQAQLMDKDNYTPDESPVYLVLGVPAQITLVLFDRRKTYTAPFTLPTGISSWKFFADIDWDRRTTPLIEADHAEITATQTSSRTQIVIPIPEMAGERLVSLIGTRRQLSGLTAELSGYDSEEKLVFVLQFEGIVIRNRIGSLQENDE